MARAELSEGEVYHVYNRGIEKRTIFGGDDDRWRFLTLMVLLQGDSVVDQIGRMVFSVKHRMFDKPVFKEVIRNRYTELVAFCLMPNHFHMILRETKEGGISKFMQRFLNAYTKYFNAKYRRSGHLFEGKFKSAHVDTDEYLDYLSAYIHLNPRELRGFSGLEVNYTWSSFQDFVHENRLGGFLKPGIILEKFYKGSEYEKFVTELPIKTTRDNLDGDLLID